jgi:hypothetical protein
VIGMITALGDVEAPGGLEGLHSGAINGPLTTALPPSPALGEGRHRSLARRLVAVPLVADTLRSAVPRLRTLALEARHRPCAE